MVLDFLSKGLCNAAAPWSLSSTAITCHTSVFTCGYDEVSICRIKGYIVQWVGDVGIVNGFQDLLMRVVQHACGCTSVIARSPYILAGYYRSLST